MNKQIVRFVAFLKKRSYYIHDIARKKPFLASLLEIFFHPRLWSFRPREAAGGIALGVFLAFTPLMGIHIVLGIFLAYVFKVNLPLAMLFVWISNPLTYPFLLLLFYYLGSFLLGLEGQYRVRGNLITVFLGLSKPVWVGSLFIATILSLLSYYSSLMFISLERKVRHKLILLKRLKKKRKSLNVTTDSIPSKPS